MFVLYLMKLAGRLFLSLVRAVEGAVEVDDRGFRCRDRKKYA